MDSNVKYPTILQALRNKILSGEWKPGERIPPRTELIKIFHTTPTTLQKAMDRLQEEGWILSKGHHGSFVVPFLPYQRRIGIVFGIGPQDTQHWHRMHMAVYEEIMRMKREKIYEFEVYFDVLNQSSKDKERLLDDIRNSRLGAVYIFAMPVNFFQNTELFSTKGLKIAASSTSQCPGVIYTEFSPFFPRAIEELFKRGKKRLALIGSVFTSNIQRDFAYELEKRGFSWNPHYCLQVWPGSSLAISLAYLYMRLPEEERPDGIIVNDDYIVDAVTEGIIESGRRVPEDVEVVVQCNFPYLPPVKTPVIHLGYNWSQIIRDVVRALVTDEPIEKVQAPLLSEDEWRATQLSPLGWLFPGHSNMDANLVTT